MPSTSRSRFDGPRWSSPNDGPRPSCSPSDGRVVSRRTLLGGLVAVQSGLLAGCFSPNMGGPVADLSVYNATARAIEVSLEVTRTSDGTVVVEDRFTLDPEADRDYPQPFAEDGRKRLVVVVDGTRRASLEWEESAGADSSGVDVTVSGDEISIDQVVA